MVEYRKAFKSEENDILDFINMVFSQSRVPHDFSKLLGKVYAYPGFSDIHYVGIEQDGHIKSTVAVLPMNLRPSKDTALKLGYIGSVSVHGYARGEGHMKKVVSLAVEDSKNSGFDLLALGGQRQRYNYFGFERAGATVNFQINSSNLRHAFKSVNTDGLILREIVREENSLLDQIFKMAQDKPFRCEWNRQRLWEILHSWCGTAYVLLNRDGIFLGYLYAIGNNIAEYGLADMNLLKPLLMLFMKEHAECEVTVPLFDTVSLNLLNSFAESYQITDNDMYHIFNWEKVLKILFDLKSEMEPLADGKFVFKIENAGCYAMEAANGFTSVYSTDESPAVCFTENKAVEFFFSPYTALTAHNMMLKSWLPLPLYLSATDTF